MCRCSHAEVKAGVCLCVCVDVSSELEAMLKQELEHTERLDAHFVEYLRCRGMSPTDNTDSAAGSMHESHERLAPELQVDIRYVCGAREMDVTDHSSHVCVCRVGRVKACVPGELQDLVVVTSPHPIGSVPP